MKLKTTRCKKSGYRAYLQREKKDTTEQLPPVENDFTNTDIDFLQQGHYISKRDQKKKKRKGTCISGQKI